MSGYLRKKQKNGAKWKRFHFVLKDRVLYAYKAAEDAMPFDTFPILGFTLETLSEVSLIWIFTPKLSWPIFSNLFNIFYQFLKVFFDVWKMRLFYNFWTLCTFRSISSSNGYSNWKKAFIQTYAHSIIDCKMSIWQYVVIEPIKMHLLKIHFMTELLKMQFIFTEEYRALRGRKWRLSLSIGSPRTWNIDFLCW